MNRYLTPAQLAKLAGVHPTTILKAIQAGRLAVTTTPGGHHRIERREAVKFLETLGISPATLQRRKTRVLVITGDAELGNEIAARRNGRFEVEIADRLVSAGVAIGRFNPDIVVADGRMEGLLTNENIPLLRAEPRSKVLALINEHADLIDPANPVSREINAWVADPRNVDEIYGKIRELARSTEVWERLIA